MGAGVARQGAASGGALGARSGPAALHRLNAGVTSMRVLLPEGWKPPVGYANGIEAEGRLVFIAGQVGWTAAQEFVSSDLAPQFEQALRNILAVLAQAGGKPEHICRITAYCCDRDAYLAARGELGRIWRAHIGHHYPAM